MLDPVGTKAKGEGQNEESGNRVPTSADTSQRTGGRRAEAASRRAAENLGSGGSGTLIGPAYWAFIRHVNYLRVLRHSDAIAGLVPVMNHKSRYTLLALTA